MKFGWCWICIIHLWHNDCPQFCSLLTGVKRERKGKPTGKCGRQSSDCEKKEGSYECVGVLLCGHELTWISVYWQGDSHSSFSYSSFK